jgi:hypothetical protein
MTASSYKVGTIELQFILGAILVKPGPSAPRMRALAEAKATEAAGAETIIAQGMEARGHRGAFDATKTSSGWSVSGAGVRRICNCCHHACVEPRRGTAH